MADRFACFVAIDWSGAVGPRQPGIAVAMCGAGAKAPALVPSVQIWSRSDVADWLEYELPDNALVGLDLGVSLPFADRGAFLPGWDETPADAKSLWALVDRVCVSDPNLAATSFVDHGKAAQHFRRSGGRTGENFEAGRGRLRVTEVRQRDIGLNPYSNFNLVGAAQVGKSSLTGMRMLHRLSGRISVWPIDPLPPSGSVVVEIYTTLAALAGGRRPGRSKMRTVEALNEALDALGSEPIAGTGAIADHASDALLSAAWLRTVHSNAGLWKPPGLDPVRHTEGWTFGVP